MTRILLVDDDEDIQEIVAMTLEDCEVISAHNGGEAVKMYAIMKRNGIPPDVVLQDLGLPDIDGVEVTRRIMKMDPEAIICILSGSDRDKMGNALQAGAIDFLPKPFHLRQLREKIGLLTHKVYA